MRSTLILLTLACMPAICQENANPAPGSGTPAFSGGIPQRLSDALRLKLGYNFDAHAAQTPQKELPLPLLRMMSAKPAITTCSIPLVKVSSPANPVAMPNMMPKLTVPRNNSGQTAPIDNMKIVAPAPACPADFGKVSAPRTTP